MLQLVCLSYSGCTAAGECWQHVVPAALPETSHPTPGLLGLCSQVRVLAYPAADVDMARVSSSTQALVTQVTSFGKSGHDLWGLKSRRIACILRHLRRQQMSTAEKRRPLLLILELDCLVLQLSRVWLE